MTVAEANVANTLSDEREMQTDLKPMGWLESLVIFAIPAAITFVTFHLGMGWLEALGLEPLQRFLVALVVPMALMLVAAIVGYSVVEGRPLERKAFAARMRFPRLRFKDILLGLGVYVLMLIGYGAFGVLNRALLTAGIIPLPSDVFPLVDPFIEPSAALVDWMAGGSMLGRWDLFVVYFVVLIFNHVGEELWWRGYVLPRQELAFGRWAWLVHGLMWNLFHVFKWWELVALLPVTLGLSYAAYRFKNNWPGFIAHYLANGFGIFMVLMGVLGKL